MAAVQDVQMELDAEKETKPEILSDGTANISGNAASGTLSSSPLTAGGAPKQEEQQTLIAVLQFLKRNKLTESVDILRREAGLEEQEDSQTLDGSGGGKSDGDGGDTNSLLSRVSIASAAAPQTPTPMPVKSECRLQLLFDDILPCNVPLINKVKVHCTF